MSRRKQAKPIRHLEDGSPVFNGKNNSVKIEYDKLNRVLQFSCIAKPDHLVNANFLRKLDFL